jgi:hypothetical protein
MNNIKTSKIRKFAKFARRSLMKQISKKLDSVLADGRKSGQLHTQSVVEIEELVREHGTSWVVERVAYIWFNRFCALRYMDVKGYTAFGIVTPERGRFQPELLSNAKESKFDSTLIPIEVQQKIKAVLEKTKSVYEVQGGVYRELILAVCNYYQKVMPYLFQATGDYTELLIPDDLLSQKSILAYIRESLTPGACKNEELFGLLYQFYISEKKNDVLNSGQSIVADTIPAATQYYTPDYIIRFLVENSLGRLWVLNHPKSNLVENMNYFIIPECPVASFLKIQDPEEIRVCDPSCGSGHMLTYSFDLLYSIYEEEGYQPSEIPAKILTHNIFGIEIDERAGQLSAFSLTMKARKKDPFFFEKLIHPNICILRKTDYNAGVSDSYGQDTMVCEGSSSIVDRLVAHGVDRNDLIHDLNMLTEADNYGSLLKPQLSEKEIARIIDDLTHDLSMFPKADNYGSPLKPQLPKKENPRIIDVLAPQTVYTEAKKYIEVFKQAQYLSANYSVVVSNPPHMGIKTMDAKMRKWASSRYSAGRSDLFAMFIERNLELVCPRGFQAMITLKDWLNLPSYKELQMKVSKNTSLVTAARLGKKPFDNIAGNDFAPSAFVLMKSKELNCDAAVLQLLDGSTETESKKSLLRLVKKLNAKSLNTVHEEGQ